MSQKARAIVIACVVVIITGVLTYFCLSTGIPGALQQQAERDTPLKQPHFTKAGDMGDTAGQDDSEDTGLGEDAEDGGEGEEADDPAEAEGPAAEAEAPAE